MGYLAVRGGDEAIAAAEDALELLRTRGAVEGESPLTLEAIEHQLHFLHSIVLSEGGLYDPQLAALALKQSLGDPLEAAFFLRAHRCTRPRIAELGPLDMRRMRVIRRISSAFKDIPGGQVLGPTSDYRYRLFHFDLLDETPAQFREALRRWLLAAGREEASQAVPSQPGKVLDFLRSQGLLEPLPSPSDEAFDITRQPLVFPVSRSAVLAILARGQQGSLLGLAYSSMNGYGDVHPTIAELRVGYVPVEVPHPVTGAPLEIGELLISECEVVAMFEQGEDDQQLRGRATGLGDGRVLQEPPRFSLGYGACFGHNETKAICMAILDRTLQSRGEGTPRHPAEDPEFVLLHVDGVDSMGFTQHWKLPHYVTFQSKLDSLRRTQEKQRGEADPDATAESSGAAVFREVER